MTQESLQNISSLLTSRVSSSVGKSKRGSKTINPHQEWDDTSRTSLVILWGLLIYPQLDPDMKKRNQVPEVKLDHVYLLFQEYLGSDSEWKGILSRLKKYDYIRYRSKNRITAGTRLWTALDAAKMYPLFRTSVLVRQFWTNSVSSETEK